MCAGVFLHNNFPVSTVETYTTLDLFIDLFSLCICWSYLSKAFFEYCKNICFALGKLRIYNNKNIIWWVWAGMIFDLVNLRIKMFFLAIRYCLSTAFHIDIQFSCGRKGKLVVFLKRFCMKYYDNKIQMVGKICEQVFYTDVLKIPMKCL